MQRGGLYYKLWVEQAQAGDAGADVTQLKEPVMIGVGRQGESVTV
jgi:hypothetical protein